MEVNLLFLPSKSLFSSVRNDSFQMQGHTPAGQPQPMAEHGGELGPRHFYLVGTPL